VTSSPPARRTFASRRVTRLALLLLVAASAIAGLVDHARHGEAERRPAPAPASSGAAPSAPAPPGPSPS